MHAPAVILLVVLTAAPVSAAQGDAPGRYVFVPVEAGTLRLDTATGEVSLCGDAGGETACTRVPDDGADQVRSAGVEARFAALEERVAALEDRVAADDLLSDEESLDRVMALTDRMIRHFFGLVRDIRREMEGEER
jgi:hypothetical protein